MSFPPRPATLSLQEYEPVRVAFEALGERDQRALADRAGFAGAAPLTLAQIGARLGVTRERARQLANHAHADLARALARADARRGPDWLPPPAVFEDASRRVKLLLKAL